MNNKKQPFPRPLLASKHPQKPPLHSPAFRTLASVAKRLPAKHNYAGKETAAPMGALLMTESTQRPFCVFCGNWITGLSLFLWLRLCRAGFFATIGLLVRASRATRKSNPTQFTTENTEDTEPKAFLRALRALRGELIIIPSLLAASPRHVFCSH
jgi:hypothetical protein